MRAHPAAASSFVRQARAAGTPTTRLLQQIDAGGTTALLADLVANFPAGAFVEIGAPAAG